LRSRWGDFRKPLGTGSEGGREAIPILEQQGPDVVLLAGLNGDEAEHPLSASLGLADRLLDFPPLRYEPS